MLVFKAQVRLKWIVWAEVMELHAALVVAENMAAGVLPGSFRACGEDALLQASGQKRALLNAICRFSAVTAHRASLSVPAAPAAPAAHGAQAAPVASAVPTTKTELTWGKMF